MSKRQKRQTTTLQNSKTVSARMLHKEWARIERACRITGQTPGEFMRRGIMDAVKLTEEKMDWERIKAACSGTGQEPTEFVQMAVLNEVLFVEQQQKESS